MRALEGFKVGLLLEVLVLERLAHGLSGFRITENGRPRRRVTVQREPDMTFVTKTAEQIAA